MPLLILLTFLLVWQSAAAAPNDGGAVDSLKAYAAYKAGSYEEARRQWLVLAEGGNTSAMINLSNLYEQGQGVPADPQLALSWMLRAANAGDPVAQLNLGLSYERGKGTARDPREAASWFRRAAEQGERDAQFNLGVMLATAYGEGPEAATPQMRAEAKEWLQRAWQQGHPEAKDFLSLLP